MKRTVICHASGYCTAAVPEADRSLRSCHVNVISLCCCPRWEENPQVVRVGKRRESGLRKRFLKAEKQQRPGLVKQILLNEPFGGFRE